MIVVSLLISVAIPRPILVLLPICVAIPSWMGENHLCGYSKLDGRKSVDQQIG